MTKKEYMTEYRQKNKERIAEQKKQYYQENKERFAAYKKEYRNNNRDKINATNRAYYRNSINAQIKTTLRGSKRRAAKIHRTPLWLDETDWWTIEQFYKEAKRKTETYLEPWHVDHIVPLQGNNVSGLHVPWNLRVIRGSDNLKKHNKCVEEL